MPKAAPFPPINAKTFAKLCGVSIGTVSGWCDDGMPCKRGAARKQGAEVAIDLQRALPWLLKRQALKPDAARVAVAREQARKLRMANDITAGDLLVASEVLQENLKAIGFLTQRLNAVPQRCSTDAVVQARIQDELIVARNAFADDLLTLAADETPH